LKFTEQIKRKKYDPIFMRQQV